MFHPFLTVQAGAPRHCLSIALALLAITSNITNYYYTRPPFRCAARACADAVLPAALHCSLLCISELCLRPNPCGIECTDCTAQYTLPEMGGSIEPPEPPLATGLIYYCFQSLYFHATESNLQSQQWIYSISIPISKLHHKQQVNMYTLWVCFCGTTASKY